MKKTIVLFFLVLLLISCMTRSPAPLPTPTLPPGAPMRPTQAPLQTSIPIPAATLTQAGVLTSTSTPPATPEENLAQSMVAQTGGSIRSITVVGDLAYVGMGPRLGVIDISQTVSPRLVSQSEPLLGLVTQVIMISPNQNSYLLINAGKYLVLVDISNPDELKPVERLELEGTITTIVFDDRTNIIYAGGAIYKGPTSLDYDGFVAAVDLTKGNNLRLINRVAMPEIPLSFALGEASLFAGANGEQGGLYLIKLKTPSELSIPQQVVTSTPEAPLVPTSMQVIGGRLYLGYWGVEAYDIMNPEQPIKIWAGSAAGINIVSGFSIDRGLIYVTGFSIRNPEIPVFGAITAPDSLSGSPVGKIASNTAMHNGNLIVADKNLQIFDTASPQNLRLVDSYQGSVTNAIDAAVNDSAVFVVDNGIGDGLSNSALRVLSLPDLEPLGQVTTEFPNSWGEGFRSIALEGDRVYLATNDSVWVYGINSPDPILLGKVEIDVVGLEAISAVKLDGRRLLFTAQSAEYINILNVYDLTDLQKPTISANPLTLAQGSGLHLTWSGSTLCALLEYQRNTSPNHSMVFAIDYGNNVLELKRSLEIAGYIQHMTADDNLIMLTGTSEPADRSTIFIIQPMLLKILSTYTLPENGMGAVIIGERALVVIGGSWDFGGEAQLLTFDLQSPPNPGHVEAMDIAFSDNPGVTILYSSPYVILSNGVGGVAVLDYSH